MLLGCQASHSQQGKVRKELYGAHSIKPNLFFKNKFSGITKVKYQAVGLADVVLNTGDGQEYMLLFMTVL